MRQLCFGPDLLVPLSLVFLCKAFFPAVSHDGKGIAVYLLLLGRTDLIDPPFFCFTGFAYDS